MEEPLPEIEVATTLSEIKVEAITVLLALSFCQTKSVDNQNFATIMSQK